MVTLKRAAGSRIPERRDVFRAIADPARRSIMNRLLREGARPALTLGKELSTSQPALSKHLRVLREAGLVRAEKDGRRQIYTLDPSPLIEVRDWIDLYRVFWTKALDRLERHLDDTNPKDRKGGRP